MKRTPPDSGRQRLIDATLTSLGERGYHRSTLRVIAETAGVTAGLVKHHFNGKDELMLEAYRQFKDRLLEVYLAEVDMAEPDPVTRLEAFARSILYFFADGEQMRTWAGFVELVITDPNASALQAQTYDRFLREIRSCVTGIYAARGERLSPGAAQKLAMGINSIIDGVWLECSLNPSRMTPEQALEITLDMIGGRIGVFFSTGSHSRT